MLFWFVVWEVSCVFLISFLDLVNVGLGFGVFDLVVWVCWIGNLGFISLNCELFVALGHLASLGVLLSFVGLDVVFLL